MDAFAEIICDICPKQFTNKFSLNRHVKTIHEKKENFTCTKCQKKFKEVHLLTRHQQKCGKCRRCGAQFDSLTDFAKRSCKRNQTENQKTPTKKARNSHQKRNYTGTFRAKNRKELEVLENEHLDEENPELREFLSKYWSSIRTFSKHGKVQSLHNFYFRNVEHMIDTIAERIMRDQQTRFYTIFSSAGLLILCFSTDYGYCSCVIIVLTAAIAPSHCNRKQEVIKRAHALIIPQA